MNVPVIVSAVRTAIGKRGGALKDLHPYKYGGEVIREAVNKTKLDSREITDVIMGNCLSNVGNIARMSALEAQLDVSVPGVTIDRQCGSGINSIMMAAQMIKADGGIYVAGGIESMTLEPYLLEKQSKPFNQHPPKFLSRNLSPEEIGDPPMGITAENLAEKYNISFEEQNLYALESQKKMDRAMSKGYFEDQIIPIEIHTKKGPINFYEDEHPRRNISLEQLNSLKPIFKVGGTVTAGSSSGINDGAAAVVMMVEDEAINRGLVPLVRVVGYAVTGVDPNYMGIGPVPAVRKVLANTNLALEEMDLIEINEAFAAQVLACHKELNFDMEKVNVNGGAIAHGHPIAATGTILATKLIYELKRRNQRYGLLTACIGGGQGIAVILENIR
ncbi:thiolase family protein [Oceanobacillus sp. CAU 1775]